MAFESFEAAAQALADANTDAAPAAPAAPEPAAAPPSPDSQTVPGTPAPEADSFTTVDLDSLPADARQLVEQRLSQMQGDYTRKTQEIAQFRNVLNQYGMDAESASSALALMQSLSDPNVQQQLYAQLATVYGPGDGQGEYDGEYGEYNAEYDGGGADPRDQQIALLTQRLDQFENAQLQSRLEVELDRMEHAVRQAHPDWQDADITRVQQIALAHGGNIIAAADEYANWRNDLIGAYVQGKSGVDPAAAPIVGDAHAQEPQTFATLDEAHAAALARYGAELGL